ncbi:MAG: dTDP-glucose 4,6-dehydratase [Acholeplasmatales bacterium]|nr:dTDP-glucose 4,6-dehydratase [Acholeplasmatales bacterium]
MKYLITGGAGFIGSCFLKYMINKYPNDIFVCVDLLTYAGKMENMNNYINHKNFKFYKLDICDRKAINEIFEKEMFDYVINFAAESHVDNSIKTPDIFVKTNVLGTQVLLDASLKYKVKRFHQISTDEVYGDSKLDNKLFTELSNLNPSSPYSASKASADMLVKSYHRTYGLDVTISRCSNNFGPNQFEEKLIPLVIKKALNNEVIPIYGNGLNLRDWIYVYDHCEAINLIIKNGIAGNIYNVSTNKEITNIDLVKYILNYLNKPLDLIKYVDDRLGHDIKYGIDSNKIKKDLGWYPKSNFKDCLNKTIDYYVDKR